MKRLMIAAALVVAGTAAVAQAPTPPAAPRCQVSGTGPITADTRFASMSFIVPHNGRCEALASGQMRDARIETQPKHGRAQVAGGNFSYSADAGYTGPDSFVMSAANVTRRVTITVNVSVMAP